MAAQSRAIPLLAVCISVPIQAAELSGSLAKPTLSLGAVTVDSQGKGLIDVTLSPSDRPIWAIQFDIQYDYQTLALSQVPGTATTSAAKSLMASTPRAGTRRLLIAGPQAGALGSGAIATLSVQAAGSQSGVYALAITNTIASDSEGYSISVLAGNGGTSGPAIAAVTNAASYAAGAVAPGEAVVIWGSSLGSATTNTLQLASDGSVARSLAGTTVWFDEVPAPLVYTTQSQVCAIVPYELDGRSQTSVRVNFQGVQSAPFSLPVGVSSPGVFTLNGSGEGQVAMLDQDNSVNGPSNPAARGSVVTLFATGEGQTSPAGSDGLIPDGSNLSRPLQPVAATIGGQAAEVIYAGSAPGQVSGILQVNLRVPLSIASGTAVPVALFIWASSQSGVTMAVQ
jgi:uncharacterized protein (TIGR03437 family)